MKTVELVCVRCGEPRWAAYARPYTCQRCRDVLAGKPNVIDPLPTEAQRESGRRLSRANRPQDQRGASKTEGDKA